ncbi:MAG: hypothetical protein INR69_04445 [Mucilaginibacter polytrichastri]|nr:hypothetical protein [Mucilaginibacter polytrichastri]
MNILISGGLLALAGMAVIAFAWVPKHASASLIVSILGAIVVLIGIGIFVRFFKEKE